MQYALITLAVLVVGGYFGYKNYSEYQGTHGAFEEETSTLASLKANQEKTEKDYIALKKNFDTQNSGVNQSIDLILPASEDFTTLARKLDSYFNGTTPLSTAVFLSDLRFSNPIIDAQHEFGILPFSMSITGSETGFEDFLRYVESSGDLNSKSRLLSINTMNVSYDSDPVPTTTTMTSPIDGSIITVPATVTDQQITASLNMNSYFQKPADSTVATK